MDQLPPDLGALSAFQPRLAGRVELWAADGVAVVVMNRPDKRNALDGEQIDALERAVGQALADPSIAAIVLTGTGPAFCAGGDIDMFMSLNSDNALAFTQRGHALANLMEHGPKPFIAAVRGACVAGGLELALACDFIIAGKGARLGLAEVNLGLIPGWGGTVRIAKAMPLRLARQLVLTGETITVEVAKSIGLVNDIVADDATLDRAIALARRIAGQSPTAVRAARRVLNAASSGEQGTALELEAALSAGLFPTSDVRQRVKAWVKGRRK